jgi:hypothetical protein
VETKYPPSLGNHRFGQLLSILVYRWTLGAPDVAAIDG